MTLLQAWGDSVSLLKPSHLKLFLLVTLKSVIEATKVLAKYWWWAYAIMLCCCFFSSIPLVKLACLAMHQLLFFAIIAATRPSLFQKDCAYFRENMRYFIPMVPLIFILPQAWLPTSFSVWYQWFVLFFLDSRRIILSRKSDLIYSAWNALKMVIYNVPLLLIVYVAQVLLIVVFTVCLFLIIGFFMGNPIIENISAMISGQPIFLNLSEQWQYLLSIMLDLVFICLYTNIYIKKLHDQFDLYFKQPK